MEEMEEMEEYRIPDEAVERLKNSEVLREHLEKGDTFQEIIGYSSEKMEDFYRIAYNLFQKQEYAKAADAFIFLTTLNPNVHNYWLGLGMSEQLLGNYQSALMSYAMGILTNIHHPLPHYHSATCYRAMRDKNSAIQSLKMAIECAGEKKEYQSIRNQSSEALKALENETF